ncbi:tail protein X [Aeromonas sobria]|uniref:tail protein X n=1 Tax=Aeromonas sobria TaxID=646 RepID=UPI0026F0DC33|nr:tail protein X [Aeromonas sobria]
MQLRSQQGDPLDLILFRHYGYTEQVLDLNPGLAALGPILPTGTFINMPAAPTQAEQPLIQLWD